MMSRTAVMVTLALVLVVMFVSTPASAHSLSALRHKLNGALESGAINVAVGTVGFSAAAAGGFSSSDVSDAQSAGRAAAQQAISSASGCTYVDLDSIASAGGKGYILDISVSSVADAGDGMTRIVISIAFSDSGRGLLGSSNSAVSMSTGGSASDLLTAAINNGIPPVIKALQNM